MFRFFTRAHGLHLSEESMQVCQRVFFQACAANKITDREMRETMARSVIAAFKTGLAEADLLRMFTTGIAAPNRQSNTATAPNLQREKGTK